MRLKAITALAALAATFGSFSQAAAQTVLTFNQWVPATHHFHARIFKPWAEDVEKATNGRVKIQFTGSSLGAPPRQFDLAATGVVALAAGNQTYTPDRFRLALFPEMPFMARTAEALSIANWRITQEYPSILDEYKGTKLLAVFANGGAQIFTTDTKVANVSAVEGLKLRAVGPLPTQIVERLGGVPVGAPVTEAYQMLSRGVVEGMITPPDTVRSFKMDEYLRNMTRFERGLYASTFFLVMNEDQWNKLPKEDQDAIMSVSGEVLAKRAGAVWDDQDRMALEAFKEGGMDILQASPELEKDVHARIGDLQDQWIEQANAKGLPAEEVLKRTREIVESLEQ